MNTLLPSRLHTTCTHSNTPPLYIHPSNPTPTPAPPGKQKFRSFFTTWVDRGARFARSSATNKIVLYCIIQFAFFNMYNSNLLLIPASLACFVLFCGTFITSKTLKVVYCCGYNAIYRLIVAVFQRPAEKFVHSTLVSQDYRKLLGK
jgi:hypothetical protein